MKKTLSFFLILVLVFCSFSALILQTEAYYGNNSFGNAATININQSYTSNIMDSGDVDWFKFTLTTAGKINIDFSHAYVNSSYNYWYLSLYDSNKNQIGYRWSYKGETTKTVTTQNIGLPAGTYYIKIEPSNSLCTIDYCVKVNFTASSVWEKEFNDDYYTSSTPISLNKKYYGTIMDSGDKDWFKFTLSSKKKMCVSFSHTYVNSSYTYWYLSLYDSNKNLITDRWAYKGNETGYKKTQYITLPKGTYYIKIEPSNSLCTVDYCLMVSDYVATPKLTSISNGSGKVTVKWDKVSGAKGYYVYRKTYSNGKWSGWSKVTTTTNNYYNDTNISSGKYYKYTVRAYIGETVSGYNTTGLQTKYLAVTPLKSAVSQKDGIKVTWGKVAGAKGYNVYRQTYSNGKWSGWTKIKTISSGSTVSYTDKSAKKGVTYKYTVRATSDSYMGYYNTKGLQVKDKY